MRNPGAPVCAARLRDGSAVLAFNDDERARSNLTFRYREAGSEEWRTLPQVIEAGQGNAISYCTMVVDAAQVVHMVYSATRDRSIQHVSFNLAWVRGQLAAAAAP